ncbi:MAG: HD domain-containing protein [Ruminococcaceae bacterium]|nr:HD domain-containing protein [Oscillospiraceae bacterium]
MKLLTKAIIFATEKHEGQKRKGTDIPYIVHPLEALSIASTLTNDENILAAAVLHDVVEDCEVSLSDIKFIFGEAVAHLVDSDSEDKRENLPAADTWHLRKQETINSIEKMDRESKIVVLADKLSNMRAIYRDYNMLGDELWLRFNCKDKNEHKWYYEQVANKLESDFKHTEAHLEFIRLLHKVFK